MKTLLQSLLLFSLCCASASAVEKTDLFEAGKEGYALYRIPGIVVTKQGTILAYCEARKSDRGDWGPIDVLMRRSTDGGKTWGPRQKIVHVEGDLPINPLAAAQNLDKPGDNTVNNPVAIVDHETGAVHFLYCLEYMRCFYMRSDDDGATWTEPVEITKTFEGFRSDYDWKVLATGPSHAIQLTHGPKRGRLVVPVWLSLGTGGHAHRPSVTATIYSDDHGKTWQCGEIAVPDTPEFIYPNETVVVQLSDGRVMLNTRSESKTHRRLITISADGATNWSRPRFDEQLLEPICMAGLVRVRMPQGDQPGVIAFSNPHNLSRADGKETPGKNRDRKNVTIKLSDDEGQTWSASRTLEESFSGYSDLAALPDGTILCFYERGSNDGKNHYRTGRLTVARVTEDWVRDGIEADVCVYGGTSGGVVAAVQAARMGKRVVLVEPGRHLGGMTSGGLSAVDIGEPRSVGGIAREYFSRLVASYGKTLNWDQSFKGKGGPATGGAYSIEPHVAERVFEAMIREAGVTVLRNARLGSVKKNGSRIAELTTEDGRTIRARMFLDTTYEGDLLAAAGVSYTVMREGNAKYGETYNGIHYAEKYKPRTNHLKPGANGRVPGGQGVWDRDFPLDPYVVRGDPTSGLLPLVSEGEPGRPGDPAPGVMAYCFRLCLSTANDRLPIEPPSDYDPKDYELVARFIAACQKNGDDMDLRWFSKHDPLPNQKWDFNTATFGGNLPGASWEWPEATYDRRAEIAKEIEDYHRGLLHFLATDPRVPEKVKTDVAGFGLPRDEFTDNGGWPHQIYVREGRRMVSDLVLTEHHTFGRELAQKPIGLGSYGTDIHEICRIVKDGVVIREGKVAGGRGGFGPYQIGYGAIVPKQSECENLFATFALSASHSAFASIRMEPVFMVTSQSAATAACLAIDQEVAVQKVDYDQLKPRLLADGQVLSWPPAGITTSVAAPRSIVRADSLPGIVLDDDQAEYQGNWTTSNRQPSAIGASYTHDDNKGRGEKIATFTTTITEAGEYEIRLLFTWHENRSSRTKVTVAGAGEEKTFRVNQREPAMKDRVPNALGIFRYEADAEACVSVCNEGANGYVVVDGLQILPITLAREERAGKRPSGYAAIEMVKRPASAAAVHPPVINGPLKPLKPDSPRAAAPADVHGKSYDLVIFGGTPGGIAMAVRAAREGLDVLLVNRNRHLGGILSSGLRVWDTLYEGKRSPIYDEARQGIFDYYLETYGERSVQYRRCLPGKTGHTNGQFEPAVAEHILTRMVNAEPHITVLCDFFIADAQRDGALLKTATFQSMHGESRIVVTGTVFADCSYEGDLAAVAKVPYRVGRESREEFGEPHAGVTYMGRGSPQTDDERRQSEAHKKLRLRPFRGWQNVLPGSTGEGDSHVQAFNYRTVLTDDPANRLPVARPDGYDRDFIAGLEKGSVVEIPNRKFGWNRPQVVGPHDDYVEGDWATRQRVMDKHWQATLGMLYFLQNDESVPAQQRERWKPLGLAADEFPDNGHRPYEIYVREARRIVGRYVFTQHDGSLSAHLDRAPIHPDSVGITEWYFDSHACSKRRMPGSLDEGKHMLHEITFPGQVPYRSLLPKELDNLLVPVCLSSTHVAWGTIRLEPTWMNLAESAAYAAATAVKTGVTPADIGSDALLRRLAEARVMISFFNDIDLDADDPRIPAAQYFGTKGFFSGYDAKLDQPLTEELQRVWQEGLTALKENRLDPMTLAKQVHQAEANNSPKLKHTRGDAMHGMWRTFIEQ